MNWFKNLNATPRLMSSFGVMIVLALGIGYLGISSLSNANERVGLLYQQDMRAPSWPMTLPLIAWRLAGNAGTLSYI